jgi:hypothetical protein
MYFKIFCFISLFILFNNNLLINAGYLQNNTNNNTNNTCIYCQNMVNLIKYEVNNNNSTIIDLITLIKDICSNIFGPGGRQCELIIDNIDNIIHLINNNTNSTQICKDLYLC